MLSFDEHGRPGAKTSQKNTKYPATCLTLATTADTGVVAAAGTQGDTHKLLESVLATHVAVCRERAAMTTAEIDLYDLYSH